MSNNRKNQAIVKLGIHLAQLRKLTKPESMASPFGSTNAEISTLL
jgi:hypothetical protein